MSGGIGSVIYWWIMGALIGVGIGRIVERKFQRAGVRACGVTTAQAIGLIVVTILAAVALALVWK